MKHKSHHKNKHPARNVRNSRNSAELLKEIKRAKIIPTIVEGKKDKQALQQLGFENIIVLHKEGLYTVPDKIKDEECAILTDLDKKGRQYYSTLKKELVKKGIKINDRLRCNLLKEKISHVEGLATFLRKKGIEIYSMH